MALPGWAQPAGLPGCACNVCPLSVAKATFDAISKTYSYLTPDLWKETVFTKSPYQVRAFLPFAARLFPLPCPVTVGGCTHRPGSSVMAEQSCSQGWLLRKSVISQHVVWSNV